MEKRYFLMEYYDPLPGGGSEYMKRTIGLAAYPVIIQDI